MLFSTILCDPPWSFSCWSEKSNGRGAPGSHYQTREGGWVKGLPIGDVAARDCTLLLWATNPNLPLAFETLQAWGFSYSSMITWVKMARPGIPRIGLGYHARGCTEQLLIATKGSPRAPAPSVRPASVIFCPPGEHSRKPAVQYEIAEGYAGPWLELFHRPRDGGLFPPRPGWTFAGDAVDGLDMVEALGRLSAGASSAEVLL